MQVVSVGPNIRFDPVKEFRHAHHIVTEELIFYGFICKKSKDFDFHRNQCKLQILQDYLVKF